MSLSHILRRAALRPITAALIFFAFSSSSIALFVLPQIATQDSEISLEYNSVAHEDQETGGALTVNDHEQLDVSSGSPFSIDPNHMPSNGEVELIQNGALGELLWIYTPNENFNGLESFNILVSYAEGGDNNQAYVEIVEVSYDVQAVNDPLGLTITGLNGGDITLNLSMKDPSTNFTDARR